MSYFGPMAFLDSQLDFIAVFGSEPMLYGASLCKYDALDIIENQIATYADKCMFDTS